MHEILSSLIEAKSQMHDLLSSSESGTTFADRDLARQELVAAEHSFKRERFLFTALLFDLGIPPAQFFSKNEYPAEIGNLVSTAGASEENSDQNDKSKRAYDHRDLTIKEMFIGFVVLVVVLFMIYHVL